MMYTCRQCRAALDKYARRELTPTRRRLVSAHLDTCATCYADYRRMLAFDGDLRGVLPHLGAPTSLQLAHVWAGVQSQLRTPSYAQRSPFQMRFGVALVVMVIALIMPWMMHHQQAMAVPLPPTPQQQTQAVTNPAQVIAMATPDPASANDPLALYTVATPGFSRNYAPDVSATDTP